MAKRHLVLFDVDGTLTPSRLKVSDQMIDTIRALKKVPNIDIGIVGGSNLDKQEEQLGNDVLALFDYVFSENGLVAFKNVDGESQLIEKTSIVKHMGEEQFQKLVNNLLAYMAKITIPVKRGTFIECRTGMINVCPVGRSCSQDERMEFFRYDKEHEIRETLVNELSGVFSDMKLTASIGGQISIDVFPTGWDKTYCLKYIDAKYDKIYFFGDKTYAGGNDHEIFLHARTIAYTVKSPQDTMNYLRELFLK